MTSQTRDSSNQPMPNYSKQKAKCAKEAGIQSHHNGSTSVTVPIKYASRANNTIQPEEVQKATTLLVQFKRDGDLTKYEKALDQYGEMSKLYPPEIFLRDDILSNLHAVVDARKEYLKIKENIKGAVHHFRCTLQSRPPGHPFRDWALYNLSSALYYDFENHRGVEKILEAIQLHREQLHLCPVGHPFHDLALEGLGYALWVQIQHGRGENSTSIEVVDIQRELLALHPVGHPSRSKSLYYLANALLWSQPNQGWPSDETLAEAINLYEQALSLFPPEHNLHFHTINTLACALLISFERDGGEEKLSRAVQLHRLSLLRPEEHPFLAGAFVNLASTLFAQFQHYGDKEKLSESVSLLRRGLELFPLTHFLRDRALNNLGEALIIQFKSEGKEEVLNEAINSLQEARELRPLGHPLRCGCLSNLAHGFWLQYEHYGREDSLCQAIRFHQEALELRPIGHPLREYPLYGLAKALYSQYQRGVGNIALSEVLRLHREVLNGRPKGRPDRVASHHAIARILLQTSSSDSSWEEAMEHIEEANSDSFCPARKRLRFMFITIDFIEASLHKHSSSPARAARVLEIYVKAIQLEPQAAHLGLDYSARLRELTGTERLCQLAATRALLLNRLPMAIEVLEEGRTVFWTQSLSVREDSLDILAVDEREKLRQLLRRLEHGSRMISNGINNKSELEIITEEQRQRNAQVQEIVNSIRSRPGFERFMKIESFEVLMEAAKRGPIIFLVSTGLASFGLIVTDNMSTPKAVVLRGVTLESIKRFHSAAYHSGLRDRGNENTLQDEATKPRLSIAKGNKVDKVEVSSYEVLEELWLTIVNPIIEELGIKKGEHGKRPHVHWCPVGDFAFLPLHAAGVYKGVGIVCASDFIVSSYIPSLSALMKARRGFEPIPRQELKSFLLAESEASGYAPLHEAKKEIMEISKMMTATGSTPRIDTTPLVQSVLEGLPTVNVLHLACHGIQKPDALESHFVLHDGSLSIAALTKLELKNPVLAFLSACETAKGDRNQPDQAVHLAASMLFCGFRSVIGTMWTMDDQDGPIVAKAVYGQLLQKETLELNDIPAALDFAIRELRASGVPPSRWATFVHIGA